LFQERWQYGASDKRARNNVGVRGAVALCITWRSIAGNSVAAQTISWNDSAGYAKRYGASYADVVAGTLIGSAILPSLLKQDPRYFYKGSGSSDRGFCMRLPIQ